MTKPRIIAVSNLKGGTGKTTTTCHLAAAFAAQDLKVFIIDADPQGSALRWSEAADWTIPTVGLPVKNLHSQISGIVPPGTDVVIIALAVFCITVAVAVPELMPFSRAAREKQLDQRAEALAARRPVLSEEARIIRRCAIPLYEGSGASNRLMAWYISAAVAPIVILVLGGFLLALSQRPEDAAAPSETSVGSTVIGMVVFAALGVVALVLLHVAVLAQYRRPRRLWRGVALPAALGTLLLAVIPLMMTAVARQQPGYAWTVTAAAEWIRAAIVWGSVFAPSWIAMPRLGLFGQVAVAAAVDSAERQSRHLQALRRVTSISMTASHSDTTSHTDAGRSTPA